MSVQRWDGGGGGFLKNVLLNAAHWQMETLQLGLIYFLRDCANAQTISRMVYWSKVL